MKDFLMELVLKVHVLDLHQKDTELKLSKNMLVIYSILDSMAQSVICQPITQSDGKLVGTLEHGIVWCGVWYGIVWYGMIWHGMAWHGMAWHGMASYFSIVLGIAELVRVIGNESFEPEDDEVLYLP